MKTIRFLLIALLFSNIGLPCSAQNNQNNDKTNEVKVYYFHYTRRCATCNAVENVSKNAITELYGENVSFESVNLEEPAGKTKGKELQVSGQTLLIVSGSTKINITNEGFMNARSNPDKLKTIIKEKIDPLL